MNFYTFNIICAIFALFVYMSFRFGVDSYLRVTKNSKTFIRKNKKGFLNYWIYKKINNEVGLGYIFYLNIVLLVFTIIFSFFAICFGWAKILQMPIAIINALLCTAQIPAIIFSDAYWNLDYYKRKFVVLAKNKSGRGFHSSFYSIIEVLGLLAFAIYNISSAL